MLAILLPSISIAYRFWALTDIHFNHLYSDFESEDKSCFSFDSPTPDSFGKPGCDTSEGLYRSAILNMR
jgi:hypothetical protein